MPDTPETPERFAGYGEYAAAVRAAANAMLSAHGEHPVAEDASVQYAYEAGLRVSSAALDMVGETRTSRMGLQANLFARPPYDPQEARVADHLAHRTRGIGGGIDPIGFLLSAQAYQAELLGLYQQRVRELNAQIRSLGAEPVLPEPDPEDASHINRAVDAYSIAIRGVFGIDAARKDYWSEGRRATYLRVILAKPIGGQELRAMMIRVHRMVGDRDIDLVHAIRIQFAPDPSGIHKNP